MTTQHKMYLSILLIVVSLITLFVLNYKLNTKPYNFKKTILYNIDNFKINSKSNVTVKQLNSYELHSKYCLDNSTPDTIIRYTNSKITIIFLDKDLKDCNEIEKFFNEDYQVTLNPNNSIDQALYTKIMYKIQIYKYKNIE